MKKLFYLLLLGSVMFGYCGIAAEVMENPALSAALQVEEAFAQVVDLAKPAVVVITNKQKPSQMSMQMEQIPEEFFRFFGMPYDRERYGKQDQRDRAEDPGTDQTLLFRRHRTEPFQKGTEKLSDPFSGFRKK